MKLAEINKVGNNFERSSLIKAISYTRKGTLPQKNSIPDPIRKMMDNCYAVKDKLIAQGVKVK